VCAFESSGAVPVACPWALATIAIMSMPPPRLIDLTALGDKPRASHESDDQDQADAGLEFARERLCRGA